MAVRTEAARQLTFTVAAGEERFVPTYTLPDILLVAHVAPELVDPARGRVQVATKTFTGQT